MALLLRGIATGDLISVGSGARTITKPGGVQADDYLLVHLWMAGTDPIVTPPDGWELVASAGPHIFIFGKIAGGGEPGDYEFTFTPTAAQTAYGCIAWRSSVHRRIYVDAVATAADDEATTEHIHPSVTTTARRAQLHCLTSLVASELADDIGFDNAMTPRYSVGISIARLLTLMTQRLTEAGPTGTRTVTTDGNRAEMVTLALAEEGEFVETGHTAVWVDEFNVSSQTAGVELATVGANYDVTHIAASTTLWERSNLGATLLQRGYFVGALAGHLALEVQDRIGQAEAVFVAALFDIQRLDAVAYVLPGAGAARFEVIAPAKNVIAVDAEWHAGTGIKRGKRIWYDDIDDTIEGDPVDLGGSGVTGYAYLFVAEEFETSSATIIVESASDEEFTVTTTNGIFSITAVGGYEAALTGPIEPWVRLRCTSISGGFTIMAVVAVEGVTY